MITITGFVQPPMLTELLARHGVELKLIHVGGNGYKCGCEIRMLTERFGWDYRARSISDLLDTLRSVICMYGAEIDGVRIPKQHVTEFEPSQLTRLNCHFEETP